MEYDIIIEKCDKITRDGVFNENEEKEPKEIRDIKYGPIYDLRGGSWICRTFFLA